jgi:hypothetical protein
MRKHRPQFILGASPGHELPTRARTSAAPFLSWIASAAGAFAGAGKIFFMLV